MRTSDEKDVSAIESSASEKTRVPQEDGDSMGQSNTQAEETEGEAKAHGLKFRFPKSMRLERHDEFERVYAQGEKSAEENLVLFVLPAGERTTRIGITASRKIGNAAIRNGVKRRLREIFRLHQHDIRGGYDIVVNVKKEAVGKKYEELELSFLRLVRSSGIAIE